MIKAVTVDASGVLLLPDPDVLRSSLSAFDARPDNSTCWRAHYEMIHLLDSTPDPDWPSMSRSFAAALGVPAQLQAEAGSVVVAEVYLSTAWVAAPDAADALRDLFAGGYGLAVVSNTMHGEMSELLLRARLCGVSGGFVPVAAVIDSHVAGVEKPDPRAFDLALAALGTRPSDCIHVGDSLRDDVRGAQAAGLTAVHVDPLELCSGGDHAHFASLAAFVTDLLGHSPL